MEADAAEFAVRIAEPIPAKSVATAPNSAGVAITNDIEILALTIVCNDSAKNLEKVYGLLHCAAFGIGRFAGVK
jgi:hypothetical protein